MPLTISESVIALKAARQEVQRTWKEFQSECTNLLEDQKEAFIATNMNMDPARAARIFSNAWITSNIISSYQNRNTKMKD